MVVVMRTRNGFLAVRRGRMRRRSPRLVSHRPVWVLVAPPLSCIRQVLVLSLLLLNLHCLAGRKKRSRRRSRSRNPLTNPLSPTASSQTGTPESHPYYPPPTYPAPA